MTIRKGQPWAQALPLPPGAVEVRSDAELAQLVARAWDQSSAVPPVALLGGDLYRTMGGTGDRRRLDQGEAMAFDIDVGLLSADDGPAQPFVAHVVARRFGWSGPFAVAMNAAWVGNWYLGPRAHPNDGLLDVTTGSLPLVQRVLARRRLPSGTHLPHPALAVRRAAQVELDFDRPTPVLLDGRHGGRARRLHLTCRPDEARVWV